MSIYLVEARRVINVLCRQVPDAEQFLYDKEFLTCLSEEIKESIGALKAPSAMFAITDLGEIRFDSIKESSTDDASFVSVALEDIKENISLDKELQSKEKRARIAEECLDVELKLKKKELMDKLLKVNA